MRGLLYESDVVQRFVKFGKEPFCSIIQIPFIQIAFVVAVVELTIG